MRNIAVLLLLGLLALPTAGWTALSPTEELSKGVDQIMSLLNDESLERSERDERILQLLKDYFEFRVMSRWILGPYWRKASPAQRERFIDLYTSLLEETYKGRIMSYADQYSDETIEYTGERIEGDKALVSTLVHTSKQTVPIDYKVVQTEEGWRVYDVVIEEVSLVRNFRSTYGEIVRKEGFDGLFARMEEKIESRRKGEPADETAQ